MMAGRRIRETVAAVMGEEIKHVVIAGYANGYMGYVTTKEEYDTQQYEGGHTLFGPWTLAAYQQEYARLATALSNGEAVAAPKTAPRDMRGEVSATALGTPHDALPADKAFGDVIQQPGSSYRAGDAVAATFWSSHPQNGYRAGNNYLDVQREDDGVWSTIATDADWATKCRWSPDAEIESAWKLDASWVIPSGTIPGTYRLVHRGTARPESASKLQPYEGVTNSFVIED